MSSEQFQLLQQILEARYDYETCDEPFKGEALIRFEKLLDAAISQSKTGVSRMGLMEAIKFHMEEYRRSWRIQEKRRQNLR